MINRQMLRYILGRILQIEALLMLLPLTLALIYREPYRHIGIFSLTILICLGLGTALAWRRPEKCSLYTRDGLLIVALSWLLLSFFGALPFYLSGQIPSFLDAFFETVSGFTTTGSTILRDVTELDHSFLFWRSFTHLIGGMGVLVLALAIVPASDSDSVHLMKAEVPGPVFGKLVARMRATARILYAIYLIMTLILMLILFVLGMPIFDAMIHAFGAAGTGGFSSQAQSIASYNSPAITYAVAVGMLAFGVNFNLYYLILIKQVKKALKSEELRAYLMIYGLAVLMIFFNLLRFYRSAGLAFRESFFTCASIMTTTGYSSADFAKWPLFSHIVLLGLMFIGGSAGSTAGGLKVSRVLILTKMAIKEARQSREPRRALPLLFDHKVIEKEQQVRISNYLLVYLGLFTIFLFLVALDTNSFDVAFSAVASTFNNIGPGLSVIGPAGSFADFSAYTKVILSFAMLFGRLEIYPMLYLFTALKSK